MLSPGKQGTALSPEGLASAKVDSSWECGRGCWLPPEQVAPGGREGPHRDQLPPGPSPTLCRVHRALPGRCNGEMQSNAVGSYPHPVLPPFHSSSKKRPPNHRARKNLLAIKPIGEAWRLPLHADPLARTAVCWLCIQRSQGLQGPTGEPASPQLWREQRFHDFTFTL